MHIEEGALVGGVIGSVSILPTNAVGGPPFKAIVITIVDNDDEPALTYQNYKFIQTEELTAGGIAVHPYGAIIIDVSLVTDMDPSTLLVVEFDGNQYGTSIIPIFEASAGTPITFERIEDSN